MRLNEFDYYLPPDLIAQEPIQHREQSRLLVFKNDEIYHKTFKDCIEYMNRGDLLILNESRVIPAKLYGEKFPTGGKVEILLLEEIEECIWKCLVKPSRRVKPGNFLIFGNGQLKGEVVGREINGARLIKFGNLYDKKELFSLGQVPLPPYIKQTLGDSERYQTVYSRVIGSVAAPTAGLHFTDEVLNYIRNKGIIILKLTLHVGLGTFRPVKTDEIEEHIMEYEYVNISEDVVKAVNSAKEEGRKVIAVGTTCVRALESASICPGRITSFNKKTNIFIYPGYKFNIIDGLITNFHLPRSTLFMLVSAFIGKDKCHLIYKEAIKEKYRFYSFGDACFLL